MYLLPKLSINSGITSKVNTSPIFIVFLSNLLSSSVFIMPVLLVSTKFSLDKNLSLEIDLKANLETVVDLALVKVFSSPSKLTSSNTLPSFITMLAFTACLLLSLISFKLGCKNSSCLVDLLSLFCSSWSFNLSSLFFTIVE